MGLHKIAVVIVTYNRLKLLEECLECVSNQEHLPTDVIIINNASTDGTGEYLQNYHGIRNITWHILNMENNLGGAGGFYEGVKAAVRLPVDGVLLIDDDAMIEKNYLKDICKASESNPNIHAFSGVVITNDRIIADHRRCYGKDGEQSVPIEKYREGTFEYDLSSFCGLIVERNLIKKIGLPRKEFFIWYDDTEYSFRIRKYSKILNINTAQLNHKTVMRSTEPESVSKLTWKDYYGYRNTIYTYKQHVGYSKAIRYTLRWCRKMLKESLDSGISPDIKEYNRQVIKDAIVDGWLGRLGKRKRYLP